MTVQHVNVRLVYLEIHSLAVFVLQINVQQAIHARKIKCVLVAVVSIVVKMSCVELAQHVNNQQANVLVNHTLWEIQIICACHVSKNVDYINNEQCYLQCYRNF